jgi:hypothetical protein
MKQSGIHFGGSLSFFNDWELFWEGKFAFLSAQPKDD